jgi:hypothetical protein
MEKIGSLKSPSHGSSPSHLHSDTRIESLLFYTFCLFVCLFAVLGLELRAYTLSYSTCLFLVMGVLEIGFANYLPRLALNLDSPDLCLLSS